MKKQNTLRKNTPQFDKYYTRLILLNNLSHFWSQRNNVYYKFENLKINFIYKFLKIILKTVVKLQLNNDLKNKVDFNTFHLDENIAKKYSTKSFDSTKLFLANKNKQNLKKLNFNFNADIFITSTPNFYLDVECFEYSELTEEFIMDTNSKYSIYKEYFYTYNFNKNYFW